MILRMGNLPGTNIDLPNSYVIDAEVSTLQDSLVVRLSPKASSGLPVGGRIEP